MPAAYGRTLGNVGVNGSTSGVLTVTGNVASGEKIVAFATGLNDVTLTVTDSGGNTWTAVKVRDAGGFTVYRAWADCTTALTSGVSTITFTFGSSQDWASCFADALTGCATGAPADTKENTGQLENWSTPTSTTTDGSILYGGSGYRNGTASTSSPVNGTEIAELRSGNGQGVAQYRTIATGGSHNISGDIGPMLGASHRRRHTWCLRRPTLRRLPRHFVPSSRICGGDQRDDLDAH